MDFPNKGKTPWIHLIQYTILVGGETIFCKMFSHMGMIPSWPNGNYSLIPPAEIPLIIYFEKNINAIIIGNTDIATLR